MENKMSEHDYSTYQEQTSEVSLSELTVLAEAQKDLEEEIAIIEEQLASKKEEWRDIAERQLPELMDKLQLTNFKTKSGLSIDIKETIRASIPNKYKNEALNWLRDHNQGGLIKRKVSVEFIKGEDEKANELCLQLKSNGIYPNDNATVHPQTLSSFVRDQLANGEDIPIDIFGVHRQRTSKIK